MSAAQIRSSDPPIQSSDPCSHGCGAHRVSGRRFSTGDRSGGHSSTGRRRGRESAGSRSSLGGMTSTPAPDEGHTESSVHVIGRLGSAVHDRELPSGDVVSTFTVVVDRGGGARGASAGTSSRVRVDAIPCQAFRSALRTRVARMDPGTLVEVEGTLRRRFWRSPAGLGSALEVDVQRLRRVA